MGFQECGILSDDTVQPISWPFMLVPLTGVEGIMKLVLFSTARTEIDLPQDLG